MDSKHNYTLKGVLQTRYGKSFVHVEENDITVVGIISSLTKFGMVTVKDTRSWGDKLF
jgi:hypothetical protein